MTTNPIKFWAVTYGGSDTYYFKSFEGLTRAISGYISSYYEDGTEEAEFAAEACAEMLEKISEHAHEACIIPILFGKMQILISPVQLDSDSDIHRALCECYGVVSGPLKDRIGSILGVAGE